MQRALNCIESPHPVWQSDWHSFHCHCHASLFIVASSVIVGAASVSQFTCQSVQPVCSQSYLALLWFYFCFCLLSFVFCRLLFGSNTWICLITKIAQVWLHDVIKSSSATAKGFLLVTMNMCPRYWWSPWKHTGNMAKKNTPQSHHFLSRCVSNTSASLLSKPHGWSI